MIPATAGSFLSEEKLRAYIQCSEFYSFGGEVTPNINTLYLQLVFEQLVTKAIRREILDPLVLTQQASYKVSQHLDLHGIYLDGEAEAIQRQGLLHLEELSNIFALSKYNPIYGPFKFDTKISKTPIRLTASGLFRSQKNQTLHVVLFSPYSSQLDVIHDPTLYLKLNVLKDFVKPLNNREQCKVHLFSVINKTLTYSSMNTKEMNQSTLKQIESLIRVMESGYHYPVVPCKYTCPYKSQCGLAGV